ncbi:MAG: hypothetical protein M1815_002223 [Lichina confinis]|nr:MAG: hypothetical protein M1815_002223 [Lichina confinis]
MGWNPSTISGPGPFERHPNRNVKQLLESYQQKCISGCLLYPTFRSSSVIMTLSAARPMSQVTAMSDPEASPSSNLDDRPVEASRPLEYPTQGAPSAHPEGSAFLRFWWNDQTRQTFLDRVPTDDLVSLRRACHDFSVRAAPVLFADLTVTFRASTFSKPARMAALERIGHHVRTLTFRMPHTTETFLPPLLDPTTGEERVFVYQPQKATGGVCASPVKRPASAEPKYGSWEMTDLLTQQYGPLFHAATNVPAFVRALTAMSSVAHLKVCCPGQEPSQRYRRSAVDYALISLRIAVERAPLTSLRRLSLTPVHPGAILYLRSGMGLGALPNSGRRWAQIRHLTIHMDSWGFGAPHAATDHLKLLHHYLLSFSASLRSVSFRWIGAKGPCPFTLDTEPLLLSPITSSPSPRTPPPPPPPTAPRKVSLTHSSPAASPSSSSSPPALSSSSRSATPASAATLPTTCHSTPASASASASSPSPSLSRLRRARFRRLRHAELCNAYPDASQLNRFISRHRHSLQECDFDAVELRSGNWDEALAVLTRISGSERWKREQTEMPASPATPPPKTASPAMMSAPLLATFSPRVQAPPMATAALPSEPPSQSFQSSLPPQTSSSLQPPVRPPDAAKPSSQHALAPAPLKVSRTKRRPHTGEIATALAQAAAEAVARVTARSEPRLDRECATGPVHMSDGQQQQQQPQQGPPQEQHYYRYHSALLDHHRRLKLQGRQQRQHHHHNHATTPSHPSHPSHHDHPRSPKILPDELKPSMSTTSLSLGKQHQHQQQQLPSSIGVGGNISSSYSRQRHLHPLLHPSYQCYAAQPEVHPDIHTPSRPIPGLQAPWSPTR